MRRDWWPEETEQLRSMVRDLSDHQIAPLVADIEASSEFSHELLQILKDAGLTGMVVPASHAGVDTELRSFIVVMEAISRVFPQRRLC